MCYTVYIQNHTLLELHAKVTEVFIFAITLMMTKSDDRNLNLKIHACGFNKVPQFEPCMDISSHLRAFPTSLTD